MIKLTPDLIEEYDLISKGQEHLVNEKHKTKKLKNKVCKQLIHINFTFSEEVLKD